MSGPDEGPDAPAPGPRRLRAGAVGQTIGGILVGFDQQIMRATPPAQELVRHARPDAPVPAADGSLVSIELPEGAEPPREPA